MHVSASTDFALNQDSRLPPNPGFGCSQWDEESHLRPTEPAQLAILRSELLQMGRGEVRAGSWLATERTNSAATPPTEPAQRGEAGLITRGSIALAGRTHRRHLDVVDSSIPTYSYRESGGGGFYVALGSRCWPARLEVE